MAGKKAALKLKRSTREGEYNVTTCPHSHIHVAVQQDGAGIVDFVFSPEEAYEFAHDILRGYDVAVGIAPRRP